ncbi:sensor histidine kinase [Mycobacterium hubeiense]|uniref:sensor histidine kinase n=1 Tax=Mycobacterium hubeiense TaxID=1867256 RepID=UPI000C7F1B90|nr:sensor histidine kinase [Mycobacterium sp. QGD 101]
MTASHGDEWHWLWKLYVFGILVAAMVGVVLLNDRFPGNAPVAIAALAGIIACVSAFGQKVIRAETVDWRTVTFIGAVVGLWVIALWASPVSIAAIAALYPLFFAALPLSAALVVTTVVNLIPLSLVVIGGGVRSPNLPLAIATTLIGLVAAPVIGTAIMTSMRQRRMLADLVGELAATRAESARLSREAGAAAERERLSREIHDTLAQGFTSIATLAQAVDAELDTDPAAARKHVELIGSTARENLAEARVMVAGLTPAALDEGSLAGAIRRQCERLTAETGIAVTVDADEDLPPLGMAVDVVLLRATQEALANIRKHAQASAVHVELTRIADRVRLTLSDNGVGLPVEHADGFGLRGMRARVAQVGGTMSVSSDDGMRIDIEVPT